MKKIRLILLACGVFWSLIYFPSCENSDQVTNPTEKVNLTMKIISCADLPSSLDTTLSYTKLFVEWNYSSWLDIAKADSLALWFVHSQYKITDMWFPDVGTRCLFPINTENIVTIKLTVPDTSLKSQGYFATSEVSSGCCYVSYRHYIFTRIKIGS